MTSHSTGENNSRKVTSLMKTYKSLTCRNVFWYHRGPVAW